MKSFSLRRGLAIGFLLLLTLLLGLGAAVWLLGRDYAQRQLQRVVREQLTKNSALALAPFTVELSAWRDFPHVTASLGHLALTDTSHHRTVPVLTVGRADLRLELADLWHRRLRVTRLTIRDADFQQLVDSSGHSWGLRGKRARQPGEGTDPVVNFTLDSILVYNFHIVTRNDYIHSTLAGQVQRARLTGGVRQGALRLSGVLDGYLEQLANRTGTLLAHKPVRAWVNYRYAFRARRGEFWRTRATLNGDTISLTGTHTVAADQATGTNLNLQFAGNQPLTEVLHAALPPRLRPYLVGATSPSHAQIVYTISGLSGPTVRPHILLHFGLRNASLAWPDSARRINRWDLQGTYDNGPGHNLRTASVQLDDCHIYSPAGQLTIEVLLRDFLRPYVQGRLRGRTELPALAALFSPGLWRAHKGLADLDVQVRGLLPPVGTQMLARSQKSLSVRGTVALRGAAFTLLARHAQVSELNAHIGLRDSLWHLADVSGVLDGMRFKAAATTTYLLTYLTGQHPSTDITGQFEVDELHLDRLRALTQPVTPQVLAALASAYPRRPARRPRDARQLAMTLGRHLIPAAVRLNVGLRCGRLVLGPDTLRDLAVTMRHDGHEVRLSGIRARVFGGQLSGQASWPTDTANNVAPVNFDLGMHFAKVNYRQLITRLSRPPGAGGPRRLGGAARPPGATTPALRELLLAADGTFTWDIDQLVLPVGEPLRDLHLRFIKEDSLLRMPALRFVAPQGGVGRASAEAKVSGIHLVAATADVDLRYASLDVQLLLRMLASLKPPRDTINYEPRVRRAVGLARRNARRLAFRRAHAPGTPSPAGALLASGGLTAVLRVQADQVRYNAIQGSRFQLVSHLNSSEARVDECSLDAFDGHITLHGILQTDGGRQHHPLEIQALLEDIKLPDFFTTANALRFQLLAPGNIRGTLRCAAALRTDLDSTFLPAHDQTYGYVKANVRDLELLDVEVLAQSFKIIKPARIAHLYFEPVSTEFFLSQGQVLIPSLRLNSNLTELEVSGRYHLDGRANLYVGMNPLNVLFGNNKRRVERIRNGEPMRPRSPRLSYVNLRRDEPGTKYQVKIFQKKEQQLQQAALRQQCHQVLLTQRLDTTMRLLPRNRLTGAGNRPVTLP